ncbi:UDP-glucose 4-epimerase GalE [Dactylosporangium sp. CA-139114]|uniref:UDP-glucose 4-epimerase GalE n=1 Tax=Dactylosporangium sp. CA-139114 TaxID=3239931 RepID=UPI003D99586C
MTWLVVGGAGYIGSHVVRRLRADGRPVVVLDDLSTGDRARVPDDVPMVVAPDTDRAALAGVFRRHRIAGVAYLAALKSAPESVADPLKYYGQNLDGMRVLLEEMISAGVDRIVLSSSAAVYGVPGEPVVTEETPAAPINPYGETKLMCEWMLRAAGGANGISWIALRYFNVVGADEQVLADRGGSSLLPQVIQRVAAGRPAVVTGADFPTRDGTGIRDYVHVADIADAHVAAIHRLEETRAADVYNVGTGRGYSVLEVIDTLREVAGVPVKVQTAPRREGDPPEVVAAVDKIGRDLSWKAQHDLSDMVHSAWTTWNPKDDATV